MRAVQRIARLCSWECSIPAGGSRFQSKAVNAKRRKLARGAVAGKLWNYSNAFNKKLLPQQQERLQQGEAGAAGAAGGPVCSHARPTALD